ncbi:hypothetical protein [Flavobacterium sp.]|uniref:hypothetical protein n=1 Tax=Flavobacterium sp. TaxID=239 RepID=UPI00262C9177|nr:hypothetical protein [Flavobacterium sp.]
MFLNLKSFFFLLIICSYQIATAQVDPKVKDSAKVYRNIEKYSKKGKFTTFLHKLIFEPIEKQKIKKNSFQRKKKPAYDKFEGKIIRKINVTTLDPFGYSEIDTTVKPKRFVYRAGNSLHTKTKNLAIRNLLLIKRNKPLDSLLVRESERLIRRQRYIRRVVINAALVSKNSDSVDVDIRVLDSWSLIPDFSTSSSKSTFYLREKNFLGLGHEFSGTYINNLNSTDNGYRTSYTIPTILNTFIKTTISYDIDMTGNYAKFINIERPFFSTYAKWAAGAYLDQQSNRITSFDENQVAQVQKFKYNSQDYWAGQAFRIFEGNTEDDRASNFITSVRYFNKDYVERPLIPLDSLGIYSRENLYLLSFGISSRKYTQDKYVFNFDVVEDIASGLLFNITSGYKKKNSDYNFYLGSRLAAGKYFPFGYLSGNLEYGTFFENSKTVQSTINFSAVYFTNLFENGRWKFRHFIKPQLIIGNNRLNTNTDRLTFNGDSGIQGFNSQTLFGTKKLLLTFQTQGYSPWKVLGFRLNPFVSCTFGMLGQENIDFRGSTIYSQLGAGIIISNDYLVFHSFQFSFSFYPNIPIDGGQTFKTNSIKTYDLGLQSFEINKPLIVPYQ